MSINSQGAADQHANQEQQEGQEVQQNNRRLRQATGQLFKIIVQGINFVGNLLRVIEFFGSL
ncbi:hypothetical protein [Streptomyces glaucescens]|uniref:Uncharacterized protein n=1 Tax=Streptomyces glaucescens TaxID=1907 RepID=A0A089WZ73_STRGA|nr:hypothetical protein [Streptomyces glaucescens]AIR96033.1 hypothetical protein SGLAU_00005 [Streptomyces glaucescens]AIS02431.1 hypothetical protein SGLAU_32495 [Streptomyces glaucescens]